MKKGIRYTTLYKYELIKNHFKNNISKTTLKNIENLKIVGKIDLSSFKKKPKKFRSFEELSYYKKNSDNKFVQIDKSWKVGQIKFFDHDRGFGFVVCWDDGQDYFIHISNIHTEPVNDSDYVVFKLIPSDKKPGTLEAHSLSLISKFTHDPSYLQKQYSKYRNSHFRKNILISLSSTNLINLLEKEITSFYTIENEEQFHNFNETISSFCSLDKKDLPKDGIASIISTWVDQIVSDDYRINFWLNGILLNQPSIELIQSYFETSDKNDRYTIFKQIDISAKKEIINQFMTYNEPQEVFDFIIEHLKQINKLSDVIDIKSKLYDTDYWKDKLDYGLFEAAIKQMQETLDDKRKLSLFISGYFNFISSEYILSTCLELTREEIEQILESGQLSKTDAFKIIDKLLKKEIEEFWSSGNITGHEFLQTAYERDLDEYDENQTKPFYWIFDIAREYLSESKITIIEKTVIEKMPCWIHVFLWEEGQIKTTPKKSISKLLLAGDNFQSKIDKWLNCKRISNDEITEILISNIQNQKKIGKRKEYYVLCNHLHALANLDINVTVINDIIPPSNLSFCKLALWLEGISTEFNFDEYKTKLVFLSPNHQIRFLKKLFWLAHTNKFDLTVEKLSQLTRIDFDIYSLNQEHHPDVPLDISVDIVIEAIKTYQEKQKFLFDNDLMKIVLKDISFNKKHKFQIHGLFEKCKGRYEAKFNWKRNGEIHKRDDSWEISFECDADLVNEVKKLPQRRYNPENQCWYVPISNEESVMAFAKKFRFFIDKEGSNYANNTHLAEFERTCVPNGVRFCEGRKAEKTDKMLNREFWWCCNKPCFQNCEADHTNPNYKKEPEKKANINDLPF